MCGQVCECEHVLYVILCLFEHVLCESVIVCDCVIVWLYEHEF